MRNQPVSVDSERIQRLRTRELERFVSGRPRSMAMLERAAGSMPNSVPMAWMAQLYDHPPIFVDHGEGAYIVDIDGHRYLDVNLADTSMPLGFGVAAIADAVDAQMRRGSQFLLPDENTIAVSEELSRRFGLPMWQYTLAGSSANAEAIRIARTVTGRQGVLMFAGKYHGMIEDTLVALADGRIEPEGAGLPREIGSHSHIVEFNDLDAVRRVLATGDIACVITEPALTNIGIVQPEPGFHASLRQLTRERDTLLIVDEAHTNVCAFGGLTREWGLEPDILTLAKAIGGGLPIGAYGMTEQVARVLDVQASDEPSFGSRRIVATGGTLFGNALSIAAARAVLEQVMTPEAHRYAAELGQHLADGIDREVARRGLEWSVSRLYCRTGYVFAAQLPRNAAEAAACEDLPRRQLIRLYLANRGIWEAIYSASPGVSFAAVREDIDFYLEVFESCLGELTG